jgi:predicted nucleic acid-binding protein
MTARQWSRLVASIDERGDRLVVSSIVLFEWLRGPRTPEQVAITDAFFPDHSVVTFDASAARIAARLFVGLQRARARQADIAIAACAIEQDAALWTLNQADFADIPGLQLYR